MKKQTGSKKAGTSRKAAKTPAISKARTPRERDPRLPAAGTTLVRTYRGKDLKVAVLEDGFRFEGRTYASLSALASKATGQSSINGFLWMGLTKGPATPKPETANETRAAVRKTRAPKSAARPRRAGRDPQPVAPTDAARESAPVAEAATT